MSTQLTPLKEYYKWKNGNFCCVCGDDKSDLPRFSALLEKKRDCQNKFTL